MDCDLGPISNGVGRSGADSALAERRLALGARTAKKGKGVLQSLGYEYLSSTYGSIVT